MEEIDAIAEWLGDHGYLIMATWHPYKLGQSVNPTHGFQGKPNVSIDQPFVVTRVATVAEYKAQCKWIKQRIGADTYIAEGNHYYEIRTD